LLNYYLFFIYSNLQQSPLLGDHLSR